MDADRGALVTTSWQRVGPVADRAANIFYDRLFDIAPATRAHLAPEELPALRRALIRRIDAAIAPRHPRAVALPVESPRDVLLGAPPEAGIEALLSTLREVLGAEWTHEHAAAWVAATPRLVEALRPASAAA